MSISIKGSFNTNFFYLLRNISQSKAPFNSTFDWDKNVNDVEYTDWWELYSSMSMSACYFPKVILVFYHGGPDGDGKIKARWNDDTGGTGVIYSDICAYIKSINRDVVGAIIAPAFTQGPGVNTGIKFIKKKYNEGDEVIIYGYSYGGDDAVNLAEAAEELGIPVHTLIIVDSSDGPGRGITVDTSIPSNVDIAYNFYQESYSGTSSGSKSGSGNLPGSRGYRHTSEGTAKVKNIKMIDSNITHGNIQTIAKQNIETVIKQRIDGYEY